MANPRIPGKVAKRVGSGFLRHPLRRSRLVALLAIAGLVVSIVACGEEEPEACAYDGRGDRDDRWRLPRRRARASREVSR